MEESAKGRVHDMKKLICVFLAFFLVACAGTGGSDGPAKPSKKMLKGTWEVTDIRFVGEAGLYKANLFEIADSSCFKGSDWIFIPNNGKGRISLDVASSLCSPSINYIHWSFYEPGDGSTKFQLKHADAKGNPTDPSGRGYRANIDQLNGPMMVMRVASSYQGNAFDVLMTFNKVSDSIAM